ncbi:unnamed protein product [Lota lota]
MRVLNQDNKAVVRGEIDTRLSVTRKASSMGRGGIEEREGTMSENVEKEDTRGLAQSQQSANLSFTTL